ncbi:hypothetical protein AB6A40_003720 [Gnathostoma spinigerum]|uniref:DUF5641 domain-containing protein n=1 Tax=Gnathostoma spinigerum TaxID=75299 RepID=A0ABD6ECT5_9BILA
MVLLHEDNAPRGTWRLATIAAVKTEADNMVRTARVKTSTGRLLDHTIAQLYPLEVGENKTEVDDLLESSDSSGMTDKLASIRTASLTTNRAVVTLTNNVHQIRTVN